MRCKLLLINVQVAIVSNETRIEPIPEKYWPLNLQSKLEIID